MIGLRHVITDDYPAADAELRQALELCRDTGYRSGQADALMNLGAVQQLAGDYPTATAGSQQALRLFGDLPDICDRAYALTELG
jgi:tetratricopeptide (TPR) repeat protein